MPQPLAISKKPTQDPTRRKPRAGQTIASTTERMRKEKVSRVDELIDQLLLTLAQFEFDPLGFVLYAFPWGEEGTALEKESGPEEWQREALERIGEKLAAGGELGAVIEEAFVAGHGVGKSAFVAWMILFCMATHAKTRGVVTANTDTQLRTKTWAELGKWHGMFIARELFKFTATALYSVDPRQQKTWRCDAIPWSEHNAVSFAGLHNRGMRQFMIFDEASEIPEAIYESAAGFMTDAETQVMWMQFGNPTASSGPFHRICTRRAPGRTVTRIDSRTVRFSNKVQIQRWIDTYGEDSDFVRVRVKGQFPRQGISTFISPEAVDDARRRRAALMSYRSYPIYMGVDPARFGDDWTVITLRQGLKLHMQVALYGFDGVDVAGRIGELLQQIRGVQCIVYDAVGNGADLDSALRRASGMPTLIPITWGIPARESKQYFNQRAEAWGHMHDWLKNGGDIPDEDDLADQLTSLNYGYDNASRIQLETKEDARKRGVKSPDKADSLALTFLPDLIRTQSQEAKVRAVPQRRVIWTKNA